ncbi:MAG: hypothetical protein ABSA92_02485 [Candidatus Bathyarchaeia archaeon]|jgi:hypothetical protein
MIEGCVVAIGKTPQEVDDKLDKWLEQNPQRHDYVIKRLKPSKSLVDDTYRGEIHLRTTGDKNETFPIL